MKCKFLIAPLVLTSLLGSSVVVTGQEQGQSIQSLDTETLRARIDDVKTRWAESQINQFDGDGDGVINVNEYVKLKTMSAEAERQQFQNLTETKEDRTKAEESESVEATTSAAPSKLVATTSAESSESKLDQTSQGTPSSTVMKKIKDEFDQLDEDDDQFLSVAELKGSFQLMNLSESSEESGQATPRASQSATSTRAVRTIVIPRSGSSP